LSRAQLYSIRVNPAAAAAAAAAAAGAAAAAAAAAAAVIAAAAAGQQWYRRPYRTGLPLRPKSDRPARGERTCWNGRAVAAGLT